MRGRPVLGLALATLAAAALTGCSEEPTKRSVNLDNAKAPAPTVAKGPTVTTASTPQEGQFIRGNSPATAPEEKAVEEVWFAFYNELVSMYVTPKVDRTALGNLADGDAFDLPVTYAEDLMARGTRNGGGAIASITDVKVEGDVAEVKGCLRTTLIEVNEQGQAIEQPDPPFQVTTERLVRQGDTWRVSTHVLTPQKCEL